MLPLLYMYSETLANLKPMKTEHESFLSVLWLLVGVACYNTVLAPSFMFMLIYLIVFMISATFHPFFPNLEEINDVEKLYFSAMCTAIVSFGMFTSFYILQ